MFLFLSFKRFVYVLNSSPLFVMSFTNINIFSLSVACSFIYLTVSFTEQKFIILMKPNLSIFFIVHDFDVVSEKPSPNPTSYRLSPMLSFRSIIIPCFMFRSAIHFEFIYKSIYVGCKVCVQSHFLNVDFHFFLNIIYQKKLSFLHCIIFSLSSNISGLYFCSLISGPSILFHQSICYSFANTTLS